MNPLQELLQFSENQNNFVDKLISDFGIYDKKVVSLIRDILAEANSTGGAFVGDDVNEILAKFVTEIELLYKENAATFDRFLVRYDKDFQKIISISEKLNDIKLEKTKLDNWQRIKRDSVIFQMTENNYRSWFIEPAKTIITNQILSGASVSDSRKLFKEWLSDKKTTITGTELQSLERYGSQIVFDAVYQTNGFVQQTIRDDFEFSYVLYYGSNVAGTREFCRHLTGNNGGLWELKEIPKLLQTYPSGTIKGTNLSNFFTLRGGYRCRHEAISIRDKETANKYL